MQQVNGIVLKTQDYGETNKIITLLTEECGMLSAIARGAKKSRSQMAAVSQPFIYGQFLLYVGKGMGTIHQGEMLHSMRHVREDIMLTAYATYMAELTTKLLDEKQPNAPLFDEFRVSLERMESDPPLAITLMYELKMYHIAGFAPVVNQCVNGHTEEPIVGFSVSEGGVVCERCRYSTTDCINLSPQVFHVLRLMSQRSIKSIRSVSIQDETLELIKNILNQYYDYYGGYTIKSKRFLQQMNDLRLD
ncbi:DNA repair protein RecO (recombination protein O) [Alkalibacillus flavidus]|uniref:DNA repair protein RecO n=1 Tax=Alkalibacillus flavidus TaxID=546021 RepID=A0ABV2KS75_9BACI